MTTELIIDTHRFVAKLKSGGFTDEQAESLVEALKESDLNHLATKTDLRSENKDLELRIVKWTMGIVGLATAWLTFIKFFA